MSQMFSTLHPWFHPYYSLCSLHLVWTYKVILDTYVIVMKPIKIILHPK